MVQEMSERSADVKRMEKNVSSKLAQRRLRRYGKGHAKAEKEKARLIIESAMRLHFGEGWKSKFNIVITNKQQLRGVNER